MALYASHIGDIIIKTGFTFGIIRFLRIYLETEVQLPDWDPLLKKAWIGAIPLLLISHLFSLNFISNQYHYLLLIVAIVTIYKIEHFRSGRLLLIAGLPFLILGILNDFIEYTAKGLYASYGGIFDAAKTFSGFWMVGFGFYAYKQIKGERKQKLKDAEEKRILEAKKAELEYQVAERTIELTNQKEELENTLSQLKATQNQLIQSEKLASLGELTAGIAHEIQNPLNFVNNFSELSVELAKELEDELNKNSIDKDLIRDLIHDLTQNQEKINYHGKRASSIVKGMLEHSRKSNGIKEPTDINDLVDEYLRLSYHGLRAKDKDFNATMETHFEDPLSKIKVIPQDIGRVLLNLFNNAFYAVKAAVPLKGKSYIPTVTVSTRYIHPEPEDEDETGSVEIRVRDNGTGMSESVKSKIFQPFFTTKPTGQGTGLGLSISYDIITKGHGGTLEIETKEGEYSEFIIKLPYL